MARTKQPVSGRRSEEKATSQQDAALEMESGVTEGAEQEPLMEAVGSPQQVPEARKEDESDVPAETMQTELQTPAEQEPAAPKKEIADEQKGSLSRKPQVQTQANGSLFTETAAQPVFYPQPGNKPLAKPVPDPAPPSSFAVLDPGPAEPKLQAQEPQAAPLASHSGTASESAASGNEEDWKSNKKLKPTPKEAAPSQNQLPRPVPTCPPGERRANRLWRVQLNDMLKTALQNVKRKVGHGKAYPFLTRVDISVAPDYHDFVREEDEMWLHHISDKLRNYAYARSSEFLADMQLISSNCIAYNTPGHGQYGGPTLVGWSEELLGACKQEVEAVAEGLERAEKALQDPECQPPVLPEADRPGAGGTQRIVVPHVPLPIGFRHTLRMTSSKPAGWVQYEVECPVHQSMRTADRIGKMAEFFKAHAQCREEWRKFRQKPDEAFHQYLDRLRETFSFNKVPPPNTASARIDNTPASPQAAPVSPAAGGSKGGAPLVRPSDRERPVQPRRPSPPQQPRPAAAAAAAAPAGYQAAFKPKDPSAEPGFGPPPKPVIWPSRSSGASDSRNGVSRAEYDLSRKRKAAAVAASAAAAEEKGKGIAGPSKDVQQPETAATAVTNARQLLQQEMQRYRQEVAGQGAEAIPVSRVDAVLEAAARAVSEEQGPSLADGATWNGDGAFPRRQESEFLRAKLSCSPPSSVLLLTGPPQSGKSYLVEQMEAVWREGAGQQAPWLRLDCHTALASASHLAKSLKSAVAEFAAQQQVALPLIRDQDHRTYTKPEEWLPAWEGEENLGRCLDSLARWWESLRRAGRRTACLILDAAEKLQHVPWARQLLDALQQFSRCGVHVLLLTSDSTFCSWLAAAGFPVEVETIGDLQPEAAREYFEGCLAQQAAPIRPAEDWEKIWDVCGGNLGLLNRCLQGAAAYGSLDAALKSIWREAGAKVRQGLLAPSKQRFPDVSHSTEDYSTAVATILESPYKAVSATELENRLGDDGAKVLPSLASAGLLMLREPSSLAADIPAAAYGPLQDRVVTLPSAGHAFFWSLISKASADALRCSGF